MDVTAPNAAPPSTVASTTPQYTPEQIAEATAKSTYGNVQKGADLTKQLPVFAQYEEKFQGLAKTLLNEDGSASQEAQLDAYIEFQQMGVSGQLFGMGTESENAKLLRRVQSENAIGKRVEDLIKSAAAATPSGDGTAPLKGQLAFYDSLGEFDKKMMFETNINPPLTAGKKYSGVADWKEQTNASIAFGDYLSQAKANGASMDPAKATDPKLKAVLELANSSASGKAWTDMVLQLFKQPPQDKIDLSPAAKGVVTEQGGGTTQRQAAYSQGSVFQTKV